MARRSGTLHVNYSSHGFVWWLLIGWWWRPIKWIFWFIVADLLGFKYLKKQKIKKGGKK